MKPSFILHIDYLCILEDLTNEQRGELFYAMYCYQISKEIEISSIIKIAFSQFKNQFDRDNVKYKKTVEARKQAGSMGGKQKVANLANATKSKQDVPNLAVSDNKNKKDSDSVKDNVKESKNKSFSILTSEKLSQYPNVNVSSFNEWMDYKKYKTIAPVTKTLNFLSQYDFATQEQIINTSIMNNYKGLFEPKRNSKQVQSFKQQDEQIRDAKINLALDNNIFDMIDDMENVNNQGVICE